MPKKLFYSSLVAALGGLLFGFDTAVISGAEQDIKIVFDLDGFWHGFTNSIALIGTIVGAVVSGRLGDYFGRRKSLIILALFYFVSAIGSAMAGSWYFFLFYRFIGGLAVGVSSVIGPMYISEISPARYRGRLVAMFQFNVVFGILVAFLSNYLINGLIENQPWRWMLGVEALPAIIFFALLFTIPKSPRWLVKKNRSAEAKVVLESLMEDDAGHLLTDIETSLAKDRAGLKERLFSGKFNFPILLAFLLATFNQFSGINAIMYYAPRIFAMTGMGKETALLQVVIIGLTNMVFTLLAMSIIDRFGRKYLMKIGSIGMIFFLGMTAKTFYFQDFEGYATLVYLMGFIAFFAFSQGAVIWVFLSEIFPNSVRAQGQALGSLTHWFWAALLTWVFPVVAELNNGGAYAFTFFTVAMVLQLIFVIRVMPETKGKSLEELEKIISKSTKPV
ncbi:sugar porter family MFS transporter [Membranihabitans marinus]|uniref:sugar porter family MFS transporter n=1 Tax=Membranihabitans marinus TaxID=1227546 RepID=UPI001F00401D|nr:sugar porter family MFS transporter [Membranihabitans marinus]